jgi:hypothetical protein
MRQRNNNDIVRLIRASPGISRAQLSKEAGLAKATVSVIVEELLKKQLLQEIGVQASNGGRPAVGLAINSNFGYILGISVDFCEISACILDLERSIKRELRFDLVRNWRAEDVIEKLLLELEMVLNQIGLFFCPVACSRSWSVCKMVMVPQSANLPKLRFISCTRVVVLSLSGLMPICRWRNARFVMSDSCVTLVVRVDHRVRSALLIGEQILTGSGDLGGEFGHINVSQSSLPCVCGKIGCLNTIASTEAIFARARDIGATAKNVKEIVSSIKGGNDSLRSILSDAGEAIGEVLANCINLLAPHVVIISGSVSLASDLLMEPMFRKVDQLTLAENRRHCKILLGSARANSECYGAALSAAQRLKFLPV